MFNVSTVFDNWFVVDTFYGEDGTFTEGMQFGFDGTNPYNKYHMEAVEPAYQVFRTLEDSRGTWIAYDEGTYKTIAASMEFGGLVDGELPSTRANLMHEILVFFGDIFTGTEEVKLEASEELTVYPNPFNQQVTFIINLASSSEVSLEIFDVTGQKVETVYEGTMMAGQNRISWSDDAGKPGMYFYRLTAANNVNTGKLIRR